MNPLTLRSALSGLLHDVGKMVYRAGESTRDHSTAGYEWLCGVLHGDEWRDVLCGVRYHHAQALRQARLDRDSIAYITCVADNIAAAADRREEETASARFDRTLPLYSVFTHLNGRHLALALKPTVHDGRLHLPAAPAPVSASDYSALLRVLRDGLGGMTVSDSWIDSLLALLDSCASNVPSSTYTGESPDISLYDHMKITAAAGACISEYLQANDMHDYRKILFDNESAFRRENAFLLYTADLSGIQKFIYTVATSHAQRALRSRSFFLELFMEHYIDEVLCACGLSRANLLYSGGGHCYMLLPNTRNTVCALERANLNANDWLLYQFGSRLFLAHGWTQCSANDLTNTPAEDTPYKAMFGRVSSAVSLNKMRRYTPDQIRRLNKRAQHNDGRECRVCGNTDTVRQDRCRWCAAFEDVSIRIQDAERTAYYVTRDASYKYDLPLPGADGDVYLSLLTIEQARQRLRSDSSVVRVYTKNRAFTGLNYSTRLDVCDYFASNQNSELADASEGIRRLAVCRMDVDNLGHAFVAGFEQPDAKDALARYHYVTLSRTAALSRQLSLLFKRYMAQVLSEGTPLNVSVVYSGGDDVFLLGAWNHVIEAAQRIRRRFTEFTGGSLTLSGGIGMYDDKYPIRLAAEETQALEQRAKSEPDKDSISLFDPLDNHTYSWDVFNRDVMREKYDMLEKFFSGQDERGRAFLYRMTELLREDDGSKLNLARYAYMLARLQPSQRSPSYALYKDFSQKMYAWACDKESRTQLITAIYLYVYMTRKAE